MTHELAKQVHKQVLITFKGRAKKGYNWMHAKFGCTDLHIFTEQDGRWLIKCLRAKEFGNNCPYHKRVHDMYL